MKILIVDDENISRKILVSKMKPIGTCVAVNSAKEALAAMAAAEEENAPFDIVTLDVSMPGMNGQELLEHIRKKEADNNVPKAEQVKILMVTARMNMGTINACIKRGCNGYLTKPVSQAQLLQGLGKLGFDLKDAVKSDENGMAHTAGVAEIINRFYSDKIVLPVFPSIVKEVEELVAGTDPSIDDLAKIVEKDLIISTKLVNIANSPLYKSLDDVESLTAALVRLGMKHTLGVCSALAARNLFNSDDEALKSEMDRLWLHSFAVATLAKRLAEEKGLENLDTIYLIGLVHDIGKMLLMKAFVDMYPDVAVTDRNLQLAIHEIHTTFGGVLLKKMHFSRHIVHMAEFHHWRDFEEDADQNMLIICLADELAGELGFSFFVKKDDAYTEGAGQEGAEDAGQAEEKEDRTKIIERLSALSSLKYLGLEPEAVLKIGEQLKPLIKKASRAF